jgi:excisionase family DNA binding protein
MGYPAVLLTARVVRAAPPPSEWLDSWHPAIVPPPKDEMRRQRVLDRPSPGKRTATSRTTPLTLDGQTRFLATPDRGDRRAMPYLEPDEHDRELRTMDRLLTAEEVADRLGMRTDWVWAQARAGRIPHVRLGRYRRFRESALEAWISGLEAASTKPQTARPVPLRRSA